MLWRDVGVRAWLRGRVLVLMATSGVLAAGLGGLATTPASANLQHEFAIFSDCPFNNPAVANCVYLTTTSGEFHLGSKTVPIEGNTIVLQGGLQQGKTELIGAADGNTLSHTPLKL